MSHHDTTGKIIWIMYAKSERYPISASEDMTQMNVLNPGVGNRPVITCAHLSQVDQIA